MSQSHPGFEDLRFLHYGHFPRYDFTLRKRIEGYAVVGFLAGGACRYLHAGKDLLLDSPCLWFHALRGLTTVRPVEGIHWNHFYVAVRGERTDAFRRSGLLPGPGERPVREVSNVAEVTLQFQRLQQILDREGLDSALAVHLLEGILLSASLARRQVAFASPLDGLAQQVRERPQLSWNFQRFAIKAGVSYSWLRQNFRKKTGLSLGRFLVHARLDRACLILERGERSIRQVASDCGFESYASFSRRFKERFGFTPTELKRKTDRIDEALELLRFREGRNRSDRERIPDPPLASMQLPPPPKPHRRIAAR